MVEFLLTPNNIAATEHLARLENEAQHYGNEGNLIALEAGLVFKKYILPRIKQKFVLEMGCGGLRMTRLFLDVVKRLDVVDGSKSLISNAQNLLSTRHEGGGLSLAV